MEAEDRCGVPENVIVAFAGHAGSGQTGRLSGHRYPFLRQQASEAISAVIMPNPAITNLYSHIAMYRVTDPRPARVTGKYFARCAD